jgi:hypothetical protein
MVNKTFALVSYLTLKVFACARLLLQAEPTYSFDARLAQRLAHFYYTLLLLASFQKFLQEKE